MGYPAAVGLPELREAIAAWAERRFGVALDPDTRRDPDARLEGGDLLASRQVVLDVDGGARHRRPDRARLPGRRARRAVRAARASLELPLLEENGFLPDLDAVDDETWARLARPLGQLSEQPDRRDGAARVLRAARRRSRASTASSLASDEAYTELWFDEPPASALQLADRTNVVVFNTLSKRSLDDRLPLRLRRRRPGADRGAEGSSGRTSARRRRSSSSAPRSSPGATRSTSSDARARTAASGRSSLDLFARKGLRVAGSAATMYLWVAVPAGETSEAFADAAARARRRRRARLVPRRRRARATSASRSCRPRRSARARGRDPRGRAADEPSASSRSRRSWSRAARPAPSRRRSRCSTRRARVASTATASGSSTSG